MFQTLRWRLYSAAREQPRVHPTPRQDTEKEGGKEATLYELVSFGTAEMRLSRRRKES